VSARFRAACGREVDGPDDERELAYRELAYPECPSCPARIVPDTGVAPFCRWRRQPAPASPWEALQGGGLEST
jgi:hypothetical protein